MALRLPLMKRHLKMTKSALLSIFLITFAVCVSSDLTAAAEPEFHGQVVTVRSCDEIAVRHKAKIIAGTACLE